MNIEETIANLELQLAEAKEKLDKGYSFETTFSEEYYFSNQHTVVCNTNGDIASIIVDADVVLKFLGENCV